jgi:hypothetical protein
MQKVILLCFICISLQSFSQYTYKNLEVNFSPGETTLKNYTYGNLRLYPIIAKQSFTDTFRHVGKYMTLKEALEKKKVVIMERLDGSTVNTLTIENVSSDTILIMAGEVIVGGKQNRIIGKDLLLVPKSGKIDISVYCVEAGRWENVSTGTNEFKSYYNAGSQSLRKTVEKKADQSEVWKEVDKLNSKNNTARGNSTKTYTAMASSTDFNNKMKGYLDFFKGKFANEKNVIGVIVVSGDKVIGVDMFATPDLFKSNFANFLNSYATEAVVNGNPVTATSSAVKTYMDKLLTSEAEQAKTIKEKGNIFTEKNKKIRVSSYE